jgi:hypothetical protein
MEQTNSTKPLDRFPEVYLEEIDRLEYVDAVARLIYAPGTGTENEQLDDQINNTLYSFTGRYNQGTLEGVLQFDDYITNKDIQDTLQELGIDVEKFWYLLLFALDYSFGSCVNGIKRNDTVIEQIDNFVKAIEDNCKEKKPSGVVFDEKTTLTVKIGGKCKVVVDYHDAIALIVAATKIMKDQKEIRNLLEYSPVNFDERTTTSESVQIWEFTKMFQDFFRIYHKQFNKRQKKGSTISLSKIMLISRLILLTKLSKNDNFSSNEDTLKGFIKQYKDKKIKYDNYIY